MNKTIDHSNHNPRATSYVPVIGLEVHVELKTESKMFCSCSADYFGQKPNTHTCPVCLGLPGALPVPNKTAIEWCLMIGMALNCNIPLVSKFDRKNYFYPDLAKGYQISQYDEPFCLGGFIQLSTGKKIGVTRVHMEEDTAKLTHQLGAQNSNVKTQNEKGISLIDFNRSGVPLVEIVTEPDFENASEVVEYLKKLHQIVRYLGVSNADMEKGDMRLEPNISLREMQNHESGIKNYELPKYKVEVKNINSFRFVEKAINFEIERQAKILDEGKVPAQETRGWDEKKNGTVSQRLKEEANDYRYFPEPDIPPIHWQESEIEKLQSTMPELPDTKFTRFKKEFELSDYDTEILTREQQLADYFEKCVQLSSVILGSNATPESPRDAEPFGLAQGGQASMTSKQIANYIINKKIDISSISPEELIKQIASSSQTVAVDDSELQTVIETVVSENNKAVEDYKSGKETVIMFLVGQVMRKIGKKIDAQMVKEKIINLLK